jgi:hypothetical protein
MQGFALCIASLQSLSQQLLALILPNWYVNYALQPQGQPGPHAFKVNGSGSKVNSPPWQQ